MKRWLVILAMVLGARVPALSAVEGSSPALADESTTPTKSTGEETAAPKPQPSSNTKPTPEDLVSAAKDAKAKRKTTSTKVLTNADVKKSKAKLIETGPSKTGDKAPAAPGLSSLELQDARRKQRNVFAEAVAVGEKKVAALERSAEELELRYYQENDPTYRDEVIRDRFNQTKRQLDEARLDLANARDALKKIDEPTP